MPGVSSQINLKYTWRSTGAIRPGLRSASETPGPSRSPQAATWNWVAPWEEGGGRYSTPHTWKGLARTVRVTVAGPQVGVGGERCFGRFWFAFTEQSVHTWTDPDRAKCHTDPVSYSTPL